MNLGPWLCLSQIWCRGPSPSVLSVRHGTDIRKAVTTHQGPALLFSVCLICAVQFCMAVIKHLRTTVQNQRFILVHAFSPCSVCPVAYKSVERECIMAEACDRSSLHGGCSIKERGRDEIFPPKKRLL